MTTTIRRYVETDTGHRVPNHKSKCRHLHGHRYRFEAEIEGDVAPFQGLDGRRWIFPTSVGSLWSTSTISPCLCGLRGRRRGSQGLRADG